MRFARRHRAGHQLAGGAGDLVRCLTAGRCARAFPGMAVSTVALLAVSGAAILASSAHSMARLRGAHLHAALAPGTLLAAFVLPLALGQARGLLTGYLDPRAGQRPGRDRLRHGDCRRGVADAGPSPHLPAAARPAARRARGAGQRTHQRARGSQPPVARERGAPARGRSAQGRVPGHARPRAAQPAGADPHRAGNAQDRRRHSRGRHATHIR